MRCALFILLVASALLAGACSTPERRYRGPEGEGRLIYDPERGITRKGAEVNTTEQSLYIAMDQAWSQRRWSDVIVVSNQISESFPEGSRVVEAIVKRVKARFEFGRDNDPEVGLPTRVMLDQWIFLYLAPNHDNRLKRMMTLDVESRQFINDYREQSVNEFITKLEPDADALYDSFQLDLALQDCRTLLTYYLPALELREFRREVSELTRDVLWLMYATNAYSAVVDIAQDLRAMNPPPSVKGDTLFILGQAQRQNGAHTLAADTFGRLYRGAGLRDTDTRWRAYALMWQINQTMESSKGEIYDIVPYERAMELLGEYELYVIENPNISDSIHAEYLQLMEDVYGVMIYRAVNAADTYDRIGEDEARDYYLGRARAWEDERDTRVAELARAR